MAGRGDSAELEVVDLDDAAPPDINAPVRRLLAPLRHRWRAIAVALVMTSLAVGAYAVVAVTGAREVESTWQAALSLRDRYDEHLAATLRARSEVVRLRHPEESVKEAARIYADRLEALRGQVADVRAVDPAVRRVRAAVAASLDRRIADARTAASEPTPTLDLAPTEGDPVSHLVRRALGRFRLEETERRPVAPLDVRPRPQPLAPIPTGARLVAVAGDGLVSIDVDGGVAATLVRGYVTSAAVGATHVAWVHGFGQAEAAPSTGGPTIRLGRADMVWSAGDDHFWLVESTETEPDSEVRMVDITGRQVRAPAVVPGRVVGASGHLLVVDDYRARDLHVWDGDLGRVSHTVRSARPHSVAGGVLLSYRAGRQPGDGTGDIAIPSDFAVTRLGSGATVRMAGGRAFWGSAMELSADGSRLAIARARGVSVVATDTGREVDAVELEASGLAWSPDGRFLFAVGAGNGLGPGPALAVYDVNTREVHHLAVTGELYELAAF